MNNNLHIKKSVLSVITVLCMLSFGCENINDVGWDDIRTAAYDRETVIPVNHTVRTTDRKYIVKFDSVFTDSRCPEGVYCFWSGVAGIRFLVEDDSESRKSLDIYTLKFSHFADSATYNGLKIKLIYLDPYPSVGKKMKYDSYKAKIILSKTK
ncbi:MAG: hypothetical protein QMB37_04465 [Paludibacteraceae bacterium]|nr:hypothetical protein [Bacteroidia bacterium]